MRRTTNADGTEFRNIGVSVVDQGLPITFGISESRNLVVAVQSWVGSLPGPHVTHEFGRAVALIIDTGHL